MSLTAKELAVKTRELKDIPPFAPLREISLHWLEIAGAFFLFYLFPSPWLLIPLLLFISARQYALLILLHDGQHSLLHPDKRMNHLIATWLIALPCGTLFTPFQKSHLSHHQHLGVREADPDYRWYCYGEPCPKKSTRDLINLYFGGIAVKKIQALFRNHGPKENSDTPEPRLSDVLSNLGPLVVVQSIFLVVFTAAFGWYGYFLLWMLPLITLATSYNHFRIFCEHSNADGTEAPDKLLISYISNPLELFFIAPNHMNYHAEHHLFPYVPHSRLPELRAMIKDCPEVDQTIQWRGSYVSHVMNYLRHLAKQPNPAV